MGVYMNNNGNNEIPKNFNWSILFIVSLSSIITGGYRDGFAALFPFLQRDFGLTRAQLGLHSTFFFFTSALIAIFTGRLVDLRGSKWGLVFGALFMGIFILLHSLAPTFIVLLVLAAFTGFAVSINTPATNKSIVDWFPKKCQSTALGILSAAYPIGGMLSAIILPFLGALIGWRKTICLPGALALLYAFYIMKFYQKKKEKKIILKKNNTNKVALWKNLSQLIINKNLLTVSALGFFLGAISGSIAAHFTLFLYLDYGLNENIAGLGFAIVQLGSIVGRATWGIICDRLLGTNKRKTFLSIGLFFTFLSIILGILKNYNPSVFMLFLLAFSIGYSGRGWQGLFFAAISETVKKEQVGIAVGFSLLFLRLGIMLAPPIFGYIADLRETYDYSWLFLGLMMFCVSIVQYLFFIKIEKNMGENNL